MEVRGGGNLESFFLVFLDQGVLIMVLPQQAPWDFLSLLVLTVTGHCTCQEQSGDMSPCPGQQVEEGPALCVSTAPVSSCAHVVLGLPGQLPPGLGSVPGPRQWLPHSDSSSP